MDAVNMIDFAFMVAYSFFMAMIGFMLKGMLSERDGLNRIVSVFAAAAAGLSVIMLSGDVIENIQLLKLTKYNTIADVDQGVIGLLMFSTRMKWFAIFLSCLLLAFLCILWFKKSTLSFLFGLLFAASGIFGFISFANPSFKALLEHSANILGAAWLSAAIHAGIASFRKKIK